MAELHCLNVGCADASVVKTSGETFLIDCYGIDQYKVLLPSDKNITALFVTHQHSDHYGGMKYLRDNGYKIGYLIHSPYERRYADTSVTLDEWNEFNDHASYFEGKGTKVYKPYRQDSFDKPWWDRSGLKFWMIGPNKAIATSDTRELHDACLVITVQSEKRKCAFTGDASDTNLNWVASNTNHFCGDILHASHHASLNGADLDFIKKADPKYSVISTKSGVYESVPHPTALKRYSDNTKEKVYRTDVDGTLRFNF